MNKSKLHASRRPGLLIAFAVLDDRRDLAKTMGITGDTATSQATEGIFDGINTREDVDPEEPEIPNPEIEELEDGEPIESPPALPDDLPNKEIEEIDQDTPTEDPPRLPGDVPDRKISVKT